MSVERQPVSRRWQWLLGMLLITLVTVIWGYSNVVIRQSEDTIAPSVLLWVRFIIAGLIMSPVIFRSRLPLRDWMIGLTTGSLLGMAVLAQSWAMLTVPVDEVAFITSLYVVFTPLAMALLRRKMPSKMIWGAVALSLIGVMMLIGKLTFNVHVGIIWSIVAAVGATGQIIGTTSLARKVSSVQLAGLQSLGAGILMTLIIMLQRIYSHSIYSGLFHWTKTMWLSIGYLSIFSTVIAIFLQSWGQSKISETEAALAFNMEPVWTTVFAWAILSQGMTVIQICGSLLIFCSLTLIAKPKRAA
jgi:drug/metabolite transporter (DMT)-like permease